MTVAAALMLSMTFAVPFESWAVEENAGPEESVQTQEIDTVQDEAADEEAAEEEISQEASETAPDTEVEALNSTELDAAVDGDEQGDPEQKVYPAPTKRSLGSFTASTSRVKNSAGYFYNLRNYLGEGIYGYSILQGSCTDGKGYSYHCLRNTKDWARLVKVRMSDGACIAVSDPYYFAHGNSMCYDSTRNRVVVASYEDHRRTVNLVDPDNLNNITKKTLTISSELKAKLPAERQYEGATAISYIEKYDCFVTMQKGHHNIIIYDAEPDDDRFLAKAVVITDCTGLSGVYQSSDADETYVYFIMSGVGGKYGRNSLIAFDWHAEKLQALLNGDSSEDAWYCGNGSGRYSAVITIPGAHESEALFHVMDPATGKSHFYLANYNNDPKYKTVKVKKKWKKVWKKVKKKVKWKKVKKKVLVNGKWKKKKVWKYKYKTVKKKVWKYKYKNKKKFSHYNRDSHVLYLGEF